VHPYLSQDHAQIRTNGTQLYNKRSRALLISRNKVLQQWPKGAWSQATYLVEDYGHEMALLIIIQRSGLLFHRQLEHNRNLSLDVILLQMYLLAGILIFMVRFLIEVIVFFCTEVCVSTTGEYIRTQQALTIRWK
jgi:hypothetical protein